MLVKLLIRLHFRQQDIVEFVKLKQNEETKSQRRGQQSVVIRPGIVR